MDHSLSDLANRLGGQLFGVDAMASGFCTDNREVKPRNIFVAIKGERVDGHDFVPSAFAAGAVAALVERPIQGRYILVENVVKALARMALSFRQEFDGPVIGITGSAGKTTTKEFTASACSALGEVLKTEGTDDDPQRRQRAPDLVGRERSKRDSQRLTEHQQRSHSPGSPEANRASRPLRPSRASSHC